MRSAKGQPRRWGRWVLLLMVGGPLGAFVLSNVVVLALGAPRIEEALEDVPPGEVALLLGAGPGSLALSSRLDAGIALWRAGRARFLLVSGGADGSGFAETDYMERYLIEAGVPREAIMVDMLGLRTLDSVHRARDIFGVRRVILVTQEYHLYRAVFLARAAGLEARGYVAEGPASGTFGHTHGRESLARVKAVFDVVTGRRARHPDTFLPVFGEVGAEVEP